MSQARFAEQALGLDRLENVGRLWAGGIVHSYQVAAPWGGLGQGKGWPGVSAW